MRINEAIMQTLANNGLLNTLYNLKIPRRDSTASQQTLMPRILTPSLSGTQQQQVSILEVGSRV